MRGRHSPTSQTEAGVDVATVSPNPGRRVGPPERVGGTVLGWTLTAMPRPRMPLMVSVMWAIDDFTVANGATRVVPGSHLATEVDTDADTVPLEMPAGSVGLWDGRLVHGGGANTTGTARRGLAVLYARAWLRQQENQQRSRWS